MTFQFIEFKTEQSAEWKSINDAADDSLFQSSLEWIVFQQSRGKETYQYFIVKKDSKEKVGIIYFEVFRRKTAKYAYAPYNPIIKNEIRHTHLERELYIDLRTFAQDFIKKHNLYLFRIDPLMLWSERKTLEDAGFVRSFGLGQAIEAWVMTLPEKSEDILSSMKKDTRYYVNRAQKQGVTVRKAENEKDVEAFGNLMVETTSRKGFSNFDTTYFVNQWKELHPKGMTEVYLAEYKGKTVAGALMNFHTYKLGYTHGASASDPELMKLNAPYYLHYEIMKDVHAKGVRRYSFWGAVGKERKNHPYRGPSDFKMKFPGELVSYVGPYEVGNKSIGYYIQRATDWWNFRKERYKRN